MAVWGLSLHQRDGILLDHTCQFQNIVAKDGWNVVFLNMSLQGVRWGNFSIILIAFF